MCHDKFSKVDCLWFCELCHLTARQYGEVVLPDASTGQSPGTLARNCQAPRKLVTVQGGYGTCFCRPGTNFIEHYACRGTSLIGAGKLSRYRMFVRGTGAVSRYNLSRSQKSVTVQDLNCGQMRVSGCMIPLQICLGCRSKSKNRDKQLTHIVRVSG